MKKVLVVVASLFPIVFLASCGFYMEKVEGSYEEVIPVSANVELEIKNINEDTVIKQGISDQIQFIIQFRIRAGDLKFAEKTFREVTQQVVENLPVFVKDNVVKIGSVKEFLPEQGFCIWPCANVSIHYEIIVPPKTKVKYVSASGDVELKGFSGNVEIKVQSADIVLRHLNAMIRIDSASGDIFAEDIGPFIVDSEEGDLEVVGAKNSITAITTSGDVTLKKISGNLSVTTNEGDVVIDSLIEREKHWMINTDSGDLELRMNESTNFGIQLSSSSGDIDIELPGISYHANNQTYFNELVGIQRMAEIKIETIRGHINITQ